MLTPPIARPVTQPIAEIAVTPADDVDRGFEDAWAALSTAPPAVAGGKASTDQPAVEAAREMTGLDPGMAAIWLGPLAGTIDILRTAEAVPIRSAEVAAASSVGVIGDDARDNGATVPPGLVQRQPTAGPVPGHGQDAPAMPESDGSVRDVVSDVPAKTPQSAQDKGAAGDTVARPDSRGTPAADSGGGIAFDWAQPVAPTRPVEPSSGMPEPRDQRLAAARAAKEGDVTRSASHPSPRVDAAPLLPPLPQDGKTAAERREGSNPSAGPRAAPSTVLMAPEGLFETESRAAPSGQSPGVVTKVVGDDGQAATDRKDHDAVPLRPSNAPRAEGVKLSLSSAKGAEAPTDAAVEVSDAPMHQATAPKDARPGGPAVDQPDMSIGLGAEARGSVGGAAPQPVAAVAQVPDDMVGGQAAKKGAEVGAELGDQGTTAKGAEGVADFSVKAGDVAGLDSAIHPVAARHDAVIAPTPHAASHNGVAAAPLSNPVTLPDDVAHQLAGALPTGPDQPIELTLSPEELGRVRMILSVADEGVRLVVQAERPETADLMRRHADQLARDFRDMGYAQINLSFETAGHPHRQPDPQSWGDRGQAEPASTDRPRETYQPDATPRGAVLDGRLDLRL